jgi:hypothetical protein
MLTARTKLKSQHTSDTAARELRDEVRTSVEEQLAGLLATRAAASLRGI